MAWAWAMQVLYHTQGLRYCPKAATLQAIHCRGMCARGMCVKGGV